MRTIFITLSFLFSINPLFAQIEGCVFGNCTNGYGTYYHKDGTKYTGEFKNSLYHGKGTITYKNGKTKTTYWGIGVELPDAEVKSNKLEERLAEQYEPINKWELENISKAKIELDNAEWEKAKEIHTIEAYKKYYNSANSIQYKDKAAKYIIFAYKKRWIQSFGTYPENLEYCLNIEEVKLRYIENGETLPSYIANLPKLRVLELVHNNIGKLPYSFRNLQDLEKLDISYNHFTEIPKSIETLKSLCYLNISENNISEIGNLSGKFQALEVLFLGGNNLQALPASISALANLSILSLDNNQITKLPNSIEHLKLRTLSWTTNNLKTFPNIILNITSLSSLNLNQNSIHKLPKNIDMLSNLSTLNIKENQLNELPYNLFKIKTLTRLILMDNMLTSLPENIGSLTYLEYLYIGNNDITLLPASFSNLLKLKNLRIDKQIYQEKKNDEILLSLIENNPSLKIKIEK